MRRMYLPLPSWTLLKGTQRVLVSLGPRALRPFGEDGEQALTTLQYLVFKPEP